MAKRQAERDTSPYSKRQKLSGTSTDTLTNPTSAEIRSWRDLQLLLAFGQDGRSQLRQNVQQFKIFLDSIAYGDDFEVQSARRKILLEYLQPQSRGQHESNTVYLRDLMQSWSFAAQSNNENLFSAIVAVLALFLKTTSGSLEFLDFGNQLCRTLLEEDRLRLFERGLSANKVKDHVVSPCLRLLTEIVSYDGGTAAKTVWRQRETTFKRLEAFLSMRKDYLDTSSAVKRKPSVRNNALRYVLTNLRLQAPAAKAGILSLAQGKVARAVFQDLKQDPPSILLELLNVFKKEVLSDEGLPRHLKNALFRERTLSRIASLYNYDEPDCAPEMRATVQQAAHSFLLLVCTSSRAGIYEIPKSAPPQGRDTFGPTSQIDARASTEDAPLHDHARQPSLRNKIIASFLQGLRPHANLLEKDLTLAAFQAAPELLADYFQKKKSFTYEPKLSATWIGYSMFLISAIRLPIPDTYLKMDQHSQTTVVAPVSAVIESILPSPLTQKSLTKCLNQSVGLITFLTLKVLVAAFQKLRGFLKKLQTSEKGHYGQSDKHTSSQLITEFFTRCPEMRHIIAGFRSCPKDNAMLREAYTRLLAFYYCVIPQVALEEKFDISIALSEALTGYGGFASTKHSIHRLELENLLDIAHRSPDMRWWHKSDDIALSPFTTVLQIHAEDPVWAKDHSMRSLLQSVAEDNHLVEHDDKLPSIDILSYSLRHFDSHKSSKDLYEYLDSCILQCSRKSVIYYEGRAALIAQQEIGANEMSGCNIDLLLIAIADQWPFLVKAAVSSATLSIATWLVTHLEMSVQAGRHRGLLLAIRDRISNSTKDKDCRAVLENALKPSSTSSKAEKLGHLNGAMEHEREITPIHEAPNEEAEPLIHLLPRGPPEEDEDHRVLTQWSRETIPEVIVEGTLGELIICLCSKHTEIRKQALNLLCTFRESVKTSDWSEALQVHILIGELVETVEHHPSEQPCPYFVGVFAARSCLVLADPLHPMYTKINKFLHRGPEWNLGKMPSYWADKILLHPPTEDDGYRMEVEWLLDFLVDGLRTPEDMETYRRSNIFERLLTVAASPSLPTSCGEKVLHLLYRCTYVDGSTTLITRCALLSWIQSELAVGTQNEADRFLLRSVAKRAYETCDRSKVDEWSGGSAVDILAHIGGYPSP